MQINEDYTKPALNLIRKAVKGNGVRADNVTIKNFDGKILEFTAAIQINLHKKTSEKTVPGKAAGANIFPTPQAAYKQAEDFAASASKDPASITQIKSIITQKPHNGFGLNNETIKLPFLDQDFISHDQCAPCHGKGMTTCAKCKGRGYEPCFHCNAQGFEKCNECNGNRQIRGPNGQMQTCHLCQGLGKTSCSFCRENRQIQCSICKTKGEAQCKTCGGHGAQSNIISTEITAQCAYDFDANALPEKAVATIKTLGSALAEHAQITPITKEEAPQENQDTIHIFYQVHAPQGEIEFAIKDKTVKAYLFGNQGEIQEVPDFLDTMIAPGMKKLSQAATTQGGMAENIRTAIKYKTIKQAVTLAARFAPKKAAKALMHYTPLGLSTQAAQTLITDANTALNNATKQQRIIAIAAGIAGTAALIAIYALSPLRPILLAQISNPSLHMPLNIIALCLCAGTGYAIWQTISSRARKRALQNFTTSK